MLTAKEKTKLHHVLTEAHNEFGRDLTRRAYYKLSDKAKSEDIVQDTFMKTWLYLMKVKKIDYMKPFLYHVLDCLIIDEYRRKKSSSLDVLLEKGFDPMNDDFTRMIDVLDGRSALNRLSKLPQSQQKVMNMRYRQNLSLAEIAEQTGQSKNSIAVKTHRAIERMRREYS